ncbi:rRNA cytosine-C5-methyltransferase [bacterium]|nr:MAG: rRNA cytosine-C5-methyltransferase [bacterium]
MLPEAFIQQLKKDFPTHFERIHQAYLADSPTSIRLNPLKSAATKTNLLRSIPWEPNGFYLDDRPLFTADPLFHSGAYYVQEASSMFIGAVIRQLLTSDSRIKRVLDVSAAPGGKTTHLAAELPSDTLIVANEIIRNRALILRENVSKWGNSNIVVTNNEPADFKRLSGFFDVIVVDAPCSGEGMFRKDPDSISEWSPANVQLCATRQTSILDDVWRALKPGGYLIYSTCTLNPFENELVLRSFAEKTGAQWIPLANASDFDILQLGDTPFYRCIPGVLEGEGFSFGCIQKPEHSDLPDSSTVLHRNKKSSLKPLTKSQLDLVQHLSDKVLEWYVFNESFLAIPAHLSADIHLLLSQLSVVKAGARAGELKGNELRPDQEWACSDLCIPNQFHTVDLDYEQAITYLRRDDLRVETGIKKGFVLFLFHGIPLGFGKMAGNRINNLFPMEWRIRMQIEPERYFSLAGI